MKNVALLSKLVEKIELEILFTEESALIGGSADSICEICHIMPLCHGGCSKQSMLSRNYCLHQSDEEKDSVVMNRILFNSLTNNVQPL